MHRVYLFGSHELFNIPDVIQNHISEIIKQTNGDVEFIVGDSVGVDMGFHQVLSAVGARKMSKIYCVNEPRNNKFELPTERFNISYNDKEKSAYLTNSVNEVIDEEYNVEKLDDFLRSPKFHEMLNRKMCKDCTFAICYWEGTNKSSLKNINRLKAQGKYVYVYTAQI